MAAGGDKLKVKLELKWTSGNGSTDRSLYGSMIRVP